MPLHVRRGEFTFLVADGAALRHGLATGEIRGDDEVYDEMSGQWRQAAQAVSGTWAAPQVAVWSQSPAAPDPRSSHLPSMTVPPTYHASMPAVAPRGPADWKRMTRTVGTALFVLLGVGTWIVVTAVRHSGTSGGQSESPATGLTAGADGGGTSVTVTVQTPWTASSMEPSDEVEAPAVPIPEPVPEPYMPPPPPPPPEPTPAETMADKATLGSAIEYARPFIFSGGFDVIHLAAGW